MTTIIEQLASALLVHTCISATTCIPPYIVSVHNQHLTKIPVIIRAHFGQAPNQKIQFRPPLSPSPQGNSNIGQGLWDLGASLIQANSISSHFSRYPDRSSALALGEGLIKGFKLMYYDSGPRLRVNCKKKDICTSTSTCSAG